MELDKIFILLMDVGLRLLDLVVTLMVDLPVAELGEGDVLDSLFVVFDGDDEVVVYLYAFDAVGFEAVQLVQGVLEFAHPVCQHLRTDELYYFEVVNQPVVVLHSQEDYHHDD